MKVNPLARNPLMKANKNPLAMKSKARNPLLKGPAPLKRDPLKKQEENILAEEGLFSKYNKEKIEKEKYEE